MALYEIKHRYNGSVLFKGEFDSLKLCVEAAVSGGASLRGVNLRGADLSGADLFGVNLLNANLHGANLRDANLFEANLRDVDLSGADLSDAELSGANLFEANLFGVNLLNANLLNAYLGGANLGGAKGLPEDADLLRRVCEAALGEDALRMREWHTCDTTHCLAGWAIHLSGHAGYALERAVGPETAGALLIPRASHMFHGSDDDAKSWCRKTLSELSAEPAAT